jgi:hypothetical protein
MPVLVHTVKEARLPEPHDLNTLKNSGQVEDYWVRSPKTDGYVTRRWLPTIYGTQWTDLFSPAGNPLTQRYAIILVVDRKLVYEQCMVYMTNVGYFN